MAPKFGFASANTASSQGLVCPRHTLRTETEVLRVYKLLTCARGFAIQNTVASLLRGSLDQFLLGESSIYADGIWSRRGETIEQEAKLDGIYVIRTSATAEQLSAADAVRGYKSLAQVERAFRSLKGLDLLIRPIRHRTEERGPAHIFLCMLAYYVEWHLRRVWASLLFEDEELPQDRKRRDPVLPARGSESAEAKKLTHQTAEGLPVQSFSTLLSNLASRARATYSLKTERSEPTSQQVPPPTALQTKPYELLHQQQLAA